MLGSPPSAAVAAVVMPGVYRLQSPFPAPNNQGTAHGISADGLTVAGAVSFSSGDVATTWTPDGTATNLNLGSWTRAIAASDGGAAVAGWSGSTARDAFRWTPAGGMVSLGGLPGIPLSQRYDQPTDITPSGAVIVGGAGTQSTTSTRAFRWTAATGMVSLGLLAGSNQPATTASGVSDDGNVIVGTAHGSADPNQPFRWTPAAGVHALAGLPAGSFGSAQDVSGDGTVVVGSLRLGRTIPNWEAFRWTEAGGLTFLPRPTGGDADRASATATNADGSVIVGQTVDDAVGRAAIWIDGQQHTLESLLTAAGADITGWSFFEAVDVSADGRTIVGRGTLASVGTVGFVAVIPEPSLGGMAVGVCAVALAAMRRQRRREVRVQSGLRGIR